MRLTLVACCAALALGGCTPRPTTPPPAASGVPRPLGDSVLVPVPADRAPDLVAAGALVLDGDARYEAITVGEAGLLRAETASQLAAARRFVESGTYLSDSYRVLRLGVGPGVNAVAALSRELRVGTPVSVELLVRVSGPAPAPVLRFEHVAEAGGGGRRGPTAIAFELLPAIGGGYDRARLLLGDGGDWSEQEVVMLPAVDWATYAHRIGIVLARDVASIAVDNNAVIEQRLRIAGPEATPRLRAIGGAAGSSVTVLQLTGLVEQEFLGIGGEDDAGDNDDGEDDD